MFAATRADSITCRLLPLIGSTPTAAPAGPRAHDSSVSTPTAAPAGPRTHSSSDASGRGNGGEASWPVDAHTLQLMLLRAYVRWVASQVRSHVEVAACMKQCALSPLAGQTVVDDSGHAAMPDTPCRREPCH